MTGHHKKWIRAVTMTTCLVAALHTVASVPANSERRKPRTEKTDIERRRTRVVKTAMRFLGTPYKSGSNNPKKGFDCSGFTSFVFDMEQVKISRSSKEQFQDGVKVTGIEKIKKADLVFFSGSNSKTGIGHVGIVTEADPQKGAFRFIHAARNGIVVSASNEPYYAKRFMGARRVLPDV